MQTLSRIAASLFTVVAMATHAQTPGACPLRVAGGPAGKVYELMIQDMNRVCGNVTRLCARPSAGGLENLFLLSANEAELGIVQVDTWAEMKAGDDSMRTLQAVMPLHANLLHIVTLAQGSTVGVRKVPFTNVPIPLTGDRIKFDSLSQLAGRTVATVGTAKLLAQGEPFKDLGLTLVVADDGEHALQLLRGGQVQAVFTLGGWPLPAINSQRLDSGLALADFDHDAPRPYQVVKRSYQNIDAYNVRFLAAPNVLVTRPFRPEGDAGRAVATLKRCLADHLDELQEGRYQAAWKEVQDLNELHGMTPFPAGSVMRAAATAGTVAK